MSTPTNQSAVGVGPAAVEEPILARRLDAQPPRHFARPGSGTSNLTWAQIIDALARQAQFVDFENGL